MDREEFKKHGFRGGDQVIYRGITCPVISIDFIEELIAVPLHLVCGGVDDENEVQWVRYENVTMIPAIESLEEEEDKKRS